MVRYYAYNPKDRGPRYIEITEEEYLKIKIQTDRWFISFGTCVLECEKAEYDDYYRHLEHYRYTLRNASRKRPDVLSMDAMEEEFPYETSVFSVHTEKSVEDEVMESMRIEQISHALSRLPTDDAFLVREYLMKERTQSEIAQELKISQQAVSKRMIKILYKLKKMLTSELRDCDIIQ